MLSLLSTGSCSFPLDLSSVPMLTMLSTSRWSPVSSAWACSTSRATTGRGMVRVVRLASMRRTLDWIWTQADFSVAAFIC